MTHQHVGLCVPVISYVQLKIFERFNRLRQSLVLISSTLQTTPSFHPLYSTTNSTRMSLCEFWEWEPRYMVFKYFATLSVLNIFDSTYLNRATLQKEIPFCSRRPLFWFCLYFYSGNRLKKHSDNDITRSTL